MKIIALICSTLFKLCSDSNAATDSSDERCDEYELQSPLVRTTTLSQVQSITVGMKEAKPRRIA